jgi:hypothetical protein
LFETIKYYQALRRLQKEGRITSAFYDDKYRELVKPSRQEADFLLSERRDAVGLIDEQISYLLSRHLIQKAQVYHLAIPEFEENGLTWVEPRYTLKWHLSKEAIADLRTAIRKEQKEKSEILRTWLTVVLSIIGAVTGIAALLLSRH